MENQNCELLFQYLKSILYDDEIQELNLAKLDVPYQKLGRGLQFLHHAVEEMQEYAADLSKGNLSGSFPRRDNFLCVNLKNIHANLNHLTWQAKQVAAGDYSQRVSYLGEFSEAFNTMTAQLKEREALLHWEAEEEKRRAEMMEGYSELLQELTRKSNEWIIVVSQETREVLYSNQQEQPAGGLCGDGSGFYQRILDWKNGDTDKVWEFRDARGRYYQIVTFALGWQGKDAYAHVIRDITDERQKAELLTNKAYQDSLTGLSNRLYFEECMERILMSGVPFCFCFMDLDGLKHVNDEYGHLEGDAYLRSFADLIRARFREGDLFARIGGDEFCLVLEECPKKTVLRKLEDIYQEFRLSGEKEYTSSFSYGVIEIDRQNEELALEEILDRADSIMYQRKKEHKKEYFKKGECQT